MKANLPLFVIVFGFYAIPVVLFAQSSGVSFTFGDQRIDRGLQLNSPADQVVNPPQADVYRLPMVAAVNDPIQRKPLANLAQVDPGGLLSNQANLLEAVAIEGDNSRYMESQGQVSGPKFGMWKASNFSHRPTYFEDDPLERYGNRRPLQPLVSAGRFLLEIPTLPYQMGQNPPMANQYTKGFHRPGAFVPYRVAVPQGVSRKGAVLQTVATLGIILP
ncbi:MAG: hypothetical protein AAF623_12455 [Planctomycetota bacterium]